jgi:hypothetical protein
MRVSVISSAIIFFLFSFLLPANANPKKHLPQDAPERGTLDLPFNNKLRDILDDTFYLYGHVSEELIDAYYDRIKKRYLQVKHHLERVYSLNEDHSPGSAKKKARKQNIIKSYKLLLEYIHRLKHFMDDRYFVEFHSHALRVLEMDFALKLSGEKLSGAMLFEKVPESLKTRKLSTLSTPEGEAYNLQDTQNGLYYSQEQLLRLKNQGFDISKLNPPTNSSYWQAHDISSLDLKKHYQAGLDSLHNGLDIRFPVKVAYYKKVRKTQTKPKIDIFIYHPETGEKVNYKLKVGSEMHSEPTAAALYTALGFSADVSKYVRDFKVILGDTTPFEFKREWGSYYYRYPVNKWIKEEGEDEDGHFLIFHEGLIEAKPKEVLRIGPWSLVGLGHKGLREVRGTLLFNMWISNLDLKESLNNKLILREIEGKHRFFHIQHDMGFAFGKTYIERPGEFKWDLVKKKKGGYIYLSYRCFQQMGGFKHITYADGRWMTRLIAQLSRQQIEAAIEVGSWPPSLGQLLVEKLISRRNQLVEAFGLKGELLSNGKPIRILKVNRNLTTADKAVVNGKLKVLRVPGYQQFFGPRIKELIPILMRQFRNQVVDRTVDGIAAIRYLKLNPVWTGIDDEVISRALIRTDRVIEENPKFTGTNDQYLVKDTMEIGLRLGYGEYLSGDVSYVRKYTVVYPVASRDEGRYHNNFIINLMLPKQQERFGLDRKFVAIVENYYELRGKIKPTGHDIQLISGDVSLSRILIDRQFISRRSPKELLFFEDNGHLNQLRYRIYMEFALLFHFRIPIFNKYLQHGKMNRRYVTLDLTGLENDPGKQYALKQLIFFNDASPVKKLGTHKTIRSKFWQRKMSLNLFGFYKRRSSFRVDRLSESEEDDYSTLKAASRKQEEKDYHFQVDSLKQKSWQFFDNGERHFSRVRLSCTTGPDRAIKDSALSISFEIDDHNTTDGELNQDYLQFINTVALDDRFLDFDSTAHNRNGIWGYLKIRFDIHMYQEAMEKLIFIKDSQIWQALANITGKTVTQLKKSTLPRYVRGQPVINYDSARGSDYLASKAAYFIREIKKARNSKTDLQRIRYLVKAIRKAVYPSGHGFEPRLLTLIHRLVGKENLFMEAYITMPAYKEMVFPERRPLYNRQGRKQHSAPLTFEYIFDDPIEIYHMF